MKKAFLSMAFAAIAVLGVNAQSKFVTRMGRLLSSPIQTQKIFLQQTIP